MIYEIETAKAARPQVLIHNDDCPLRAGICFTHCMHCNPATAGPETSLEPHLSHSISLSRLWTSPCLLPRCLLHLCGERTRSTRGRPRQQQQQQTAAPPRRAVATSRPPSHPCPLTPPLSPTFSELCASSERRRPVLGLRGYSESIARGRCRTAGAGPGAEQQGPTLTQYDQRLADRSLPPPSLSSSRQLAYLPVAVAEPQPLPLPGTGDHPSISRDT